jgi:hypothetical protein
MHLLVVIQPAWLVEMDDGKRMHLLACLLACLLAVGLLAVGWLAGWRKECGTAPYVAGCLDAYESGCH